MLINLSMTFNHCAQSPQKSACMHACWLWTSVGQQEFKVSKAYPKRHRCPFGSRSDVAIIASCLIELSDVT